MKDALAAAPGGGLDYYSYEPFQIYAAGAVEQMAWVSGVGDLWRSSNDIRKSWTSILANAFLTDKWAPNAKPGHYNDADELEIGNGRLTLAEQRSHFALWCVMKSPLIIGTDVRKLSPAVLGILKNTRLIAVNQDAAAVQGTLRVAFDNAGTRAPTIQPKAVPCVTDQCAQGSPWVTHCSFDRGTAAAAAQRWEAAPSVAVPGGQLLMQPGTMKCLARSPTSPAVSIAACDTSSSMQAGDVNNSHNLHFECARESTDEVHLHRWFHMVDLDPVAPHPQPLEGRHRLALTHATCALKWWTVCAYFTGVGCRCCQGNDRAGPRRIELEHVPHIQRIVAPHGAVPQGGWRQDYTKPYRVPRRQLPVF